MANLFESNWSATKEALTEGLTGQRKQTMDVVLENAKRQLSEAATAGATGAGSVATLNKVMLPLIRRVMPSVIANELVGVQPMTGPVGQIHTLRVRYAETGGGATAGDEALSPFKLANSYAGSPDATASAEGLPGKKMSIQILKETVEAKTRRLSARWTFEAAQDAESMHGVDVEAEIMQALAQ
jgi:vancomycin resistance protein YoaR